MLMLMCLLCFAVLLLILIDLLFSQPATAWKKKLPRFAFEFLLFCAEMLGGLFWFLLMGIESEERRCMLFGNCHLGK